MILQVNQQYHIQGVKLRLTERRQEHRVTVLWCARPWACNYRRHAACTELNCEGHLAYAQRYWLLLLHGPLEMPGACWLVSLALRNVSQVLLVSWLVAGAALGSRPLSPLEHITAWCHRCDGAVPPTKPS